MSDNWIVQNLQNGLDTWNDNLTTIWKLITQSPQTFKGGGIWKVINNIHTSMQGIGYGLLVLFFFVGMIKTCNSFSDIKRPEQLFRHFIRFAISKAIVTYGLKLMMTIFNIVQGIIDKIMTTSGVLFNSKTKLPQTLISTIEDMGFFESIPLWAVTLIAGLVILVLSFIMILTVYSRFFKLYIYTAIAPVPLSCFAGEPTQSIGQNFLKSYSAVCLEGAIIVLACIIFSLFASAPPAVDTSAAAVTQVWSYVGELIFNMLILVGTVKLSDRIVKEMMGL